MNAQDSGCAGMAVGFGEKADGVLAGGGDGAEVEYGVHQFRMVVGPAFCTNAAPETGFLGTGDADGHTAAVKGCGADWRFYGAIEDVAQFNGRVASFA